MKTESGLTLRQEKIVTLFAKGFSHKQIGEALSLSPLTVKRNLSEVGNRLGLRKREARGAALVAWAWRNLLT